MSLHTPTDTHVARIASSQQLGQFENQSARTAVLHTIANANTALLRGLPVSLKAFDLSKFVCHSSFQWPQGAAMLAANRAEHQRPIATGQPPMGSDMLCDLDTGSQMSCINESIHLPSDDAESNEDIHHDFIAVEDESYSSSSSSSGSGSTGRTSPVSDRDSTKTQDANVETPASKVDEWLGEVGDGYESDVTVIGPGARRAHHEKMEALPRKDDENEIDEYHQSKEQLTVFGDVNASIEDEDEDEDSEDEEYASFTITALPNAPFHTGTQMHTSPMTASSMSAMDAALLFPNGFTTYPIVMPPYHHALIHEYRPDRVDRIMKYAQPGRIHKGEVPKRPKYGSINGRTPWVCEWEPKADQEAEPPRAVMKATLSRPRRKATASTTVRPGPVVRVKPPSASSARLMARLDAIDKKQSATRPDSRAPRAPTGPAKETLAKPLEKNQGAGTPIRPLAKVRDRSARVNATSVPPKVVNATSVPPKVVQLAKAIAEMKLGNTAETKLGFPLPAPMPKKAKFVKASAKDIEASKVQKAKLQTAKLQKVKHQKVKSVSKSAVKPVAKPTPKPVTKPASVQSENVPQPVFRSLATPSIDDSPDSEKERLVEQPPRLPKTTTVQTQPAEPPATTDLSEHEKWLRLTTIPLQGASDPQLTEYFEQASRQRRQDMDLRAGPPDTNYDRTMTGGVLLKHPLETFILLLLVFFVLWFLFYYFELV
ncbi:hypothetical protein BU16DRAFT_544329 [Lophium mytilinum]|uniref:Uncharacterized protein n=1 Tax=Lophium mytilinum TaxID=390894 RepID=A0A6A6QES6_9PEZI|nr:hypothetical protein BU16DRAFT_544329 [Lophium mytilinum]